MHHYNTAVAAISKRSGDHDRCFESLKLTSREFNSHAFGIRSRTSKLLLHPRASELYLELATLVKQRAYELTVTLQHGSM